ncbi:MAG: hypothetical protein Fur0025_38030 [Oscillatoriaceae cyanobacterium]
MRLRSLTVSFGMLLLLSACGGEQSGEQATSSPSPTDTPAAAPSPGTPSPGAPSPGAPTPAAGAGAKPPAAAPFTTTAPAKNPTAVSNLLEPSSEDDVLAQVKPGTSNPFGILPLTPQQKPGEVKTSQLPEVKVATVPALPELPKGIGIDPKSQQQLPKVESAKIPAPPQFGSNLGPPIATRPLNTTTRPVTLPPQKAPEFLPVRTPTNFGPPIAAAPTTTGPGSLGPAGTGPARVGPTRRGPGGQILQPIPTAAIPKQDSRQVPSLPQLPTPIGPKVPERQQPASPPTGTTPPAPPPKPTPPPPPPPPSTDIAKAVEVTGVVQVNGEILIIVKAPNEPTTRYVKVGQRIGNGKVLVKRVEQLKGSEPIVVLEENGVEVNKEVGEISAEISRP